MKIHNWAVTMSFRLINLQCFLIHYCVTWTFLSDLLVLFFFFLLVVVREQGWGDGPFLSITFNALYMICTFNKSCPKPLDISFHFNSCPLHPIPIKITNIIFMENYTLPLWFNCLNEI